MAKQINTRIWPQIDHFMQNTFIPVRIWLNLSFGDKWEKLLSDLYVLFLATGAMFFYGSKIPIPVLCRKAKGTFIPRLVPIGEVFPEEKIFERNNIKNSKKVLKRGNNSNMAEQINTKIWPLIDLIMLNTFILSEFG